MVCKKCGKLISENSSYCMYCHAPTMAGEDFNIELDVLEDEELFTVLQKENNIPETIGSAMDVPPTKGKKKFIISLVTVISAVGVAILTFGYLNSFTHTMNQAVEYYDRGDYEHSYEMYTKALEKQPDDVEALIGIGNCTMQMGHYTESEKFITKALNIESENTKAYTALLSLYIKSENPEKLVEAEKLATTSDMKEVLKEVVLDIPVFSKEGGKYTDDVKLIISTGENIPIYYTLDGSEPTKNSKIYESEILITEGKTTVRAVTYKDNSYSVIVEAVYDITYEAPSLPKVDPMNGSFDKETYVSVSTELENATIYYTWGGDTPTTSSNKYTGPIKVIEGNNILSIIVVDSHGKQSEVLKCNYTYIPTQEEVDATPEETQEEEHIAPSGDKNPEETLDSEDADKEISAEEL